MNKNNYPENIGIIGATGAVGREILSILETRDCFSNSTIRMFASEKSAGRFLPYKNQNLIIEPLKENSFDDIDIALFSAGSEISRKFAPLAVKANCTVIDNSSAFRMDPNIPLIIPEINGNLLQKYSKTDSKAQIIANPNCTTIVMLMAITPVHLKYGIKRIVVSTYQAVSGAGALAIDELTTQSKDVLAGKQPVNRVFSEPCAFNVFSHDSAMCDDGYNLEEHKVINETHKIWNTRDVQITATCIRVPVFRSHSESINLTLKIPIDDIADIKNLLESAKGVSVIDDRIHNKFPTPVNTNGKDDVFVGRIRADLSQIDENDSNKCYGLDLFVCGDQLRKGAALNAIQIAEILYF